jgi:plasmid stabilization system protein ParE
MARRAVTMSPTARRWFLHRLAELASVNPTAASNLIERFRRLRVIMGEISGMGVGGDIPGTRRIVMSPYILTVRVRADVIEIVAIRHGRQNDARDPDEAKT